MSTTPRPAVRRLGRISEISQVAAKHGFGYFFDTHRPGSRLSRREQELSVDGEEGSPRGLRVRQMLDELGPTFVKFGQLLSTRPDVVPPDIVFELKALQDDVTPFPFEEVETVIREDLGLTLEQLFFLRPAPGWAQYRTPIKNLYMCGSATHPGGGIMGAPGRNAALRILADT